MARSLKILTGVVVTLLLIGSPVLFAFREQKDLRNFRVVREGVLYRSGQLSRAGLKRVIHDYKIKTVVSLREAPAPGKADADAAEAEYCRIMDVNFLPLTPMHWEGPAGEPAPVEENVRAFRAVLADPRNHPVLVHCFAGVHRTGAYCAIYRMECEGWANEQAMEELKAGGYDRLEHEMDILGYLSRYRATEKKDPR